MIRMLTILSVLLVSWVGYSQERIKPLFKVGGYFSISQQILGQNSFIEHSRTSRYNTGYFVKQDKVYTKRKGLFVEYAINNRLSIQSGLGIAKQEFDAFYNCPVCDPVLEEIRLEYLEIQVSVIRSWTDGRIRPITGLGLASRFKQVGRYERDFSLDSNISVGLGVCPTKKIELRILGIYYLAVVSPYPKYYSNESLGLNASLLLDIGR